MNNIMSQKIYPHDSLMIKRCIIFMDQSWICNYLPWYNELMRHLLLLLYWVEKYHCHIMYDQLIILNHDDMIFFQLYCFHPNISSLILIIDSALVSFCIAMIVLKEPSVWTLIQRRFVFNITLSLLYIFKLFD